MRFPFLELPGDPRPLVRPVLPVQIEDLEELPIYCLADTGAVDNRFGAEVAEVAGISLAEPLDEGEILVGGLRVLGRCQRVDLTIAGHRFEAPVWFCDPWPFSFGLLGQEGFFRLFGGTVAAAHDWLECVPEPVAPAR